MANHKSARKRARQDEVKRMRNRALKTKVKNVVKKFSIAIDGSIDSEKVNEIMDSLKSVKSVIDKAAKKGALHKKTASRKISRLSRLANKLRV